MAGENAAEAEELKRQGTAAYARQARGLSGDDVVVGQKKDMITIDNLMVKGTIMKNP